MDARCLNDGLLVSMDFPVPDDARDHYSAPDVIVGCNRLRCAACGAWVRRFDGFALDRQPASDAEFVALHETQAPSTQPLLTRELQGHRMRVYACRCSAETAGGITRLSMGDRAVEWSCAGHPR